MALQGSGQIKLSEIATEYGGSAPHNLSEYHDKGNAPASGEIQLAADFYGTSNFTAPTASGGTISTAGNYRFHRFTGSGTFAITNIGTVSTYDVLIVAGGGSGGSGYGSGAGAGGLLEYTGQSLSTFSKTVTIGAGGSTSCNYVDPGSQGSSTSVTGFTSAVGGGGGGGEANNADSGGSGGGAGSSYSRGSGTSGQGNAGGNYNGGSGNTYPSAGGGGAGGVGGSGGSGGSGGLGGVGVYKSLFSSWGENGYYAGGGGGGSPPDNESYWTGTGGTGGGADGKRLPDTCNSANANGTANTGGGGGGKGKERGGDQSGGSGIVIFRYQYLAT